MKKAVVSILVVMLAGSCVPNTAPSTSPALLDTRPPGVSATDANLVRATVFRHFLLERAHDPNTIVTLWVENFKRAPDEIIDLLPGYRFGDMPRHGPSVALSIERIEWRDSDTVVVSSAVVCRSSCSQGYEVLVKRVHAVWTVDTVLPTWID